ncbi:putative HTH-type transcriptional regulator YybR [Planctomycetes bacterium Pan216]|uniref:Putative HTH-type transcriptional regulator YybR n=1 Tax=Kolteria novifilia TaxID=2527975 RepID=A0A518B273_9BACT|nr:putative HTH-type transcriptional regulator YybR [Planctomycetes bacterium Pan216]
MPTRTCAESSCPISDVLSVIGGRWKVHLLWYVLEGPVRFNQFRRKMPGISQKMLTQQLRELVRDGLVARKQFPEIPPRVEYSMTPLGRTLEPTLRSIHDWGNKHWSEVEEARSAMMSKA